MELMNIGAETPKFDVDVIVDYMKHLWGENTASTGYTYELAKILYQTSPRVICSSIDDIRYRLLNCRHVNQTGSTYPYTQAKLIESLSKSEIKCNKFKKAVECVYKLFELVYKDELVLKNKERLIGDPESVLYYYSLLDSDQLEHWKVMTENRQLDGLKLGNIKYVYNPFSFVMPSKDIEVCKLLFNDVICPAKEITIILYVIFQPKEFDKNKEIILDNYKKQTGFSWENIDMVAYTYLNASLHNEFKSKLTDC